MPDLQLNTTVARDCGRALRHVQSELERCKSISDRYVDAVGHRELKDRLREFVGNWDDTRTEILSAVTGLGEAGLGIADSFDGIEADLAKILSRAMSGDG